MRPLARQLLLGTLATLAACLAGVAAAADRSVLIEPQATDARLAAGEAPHWVLYAPALPQPLLVWLPGTGGHPMGGPQALFKTIRAEGYRLVALSYRTTPAVAQVCTPPRVRVRPTCAEAFRQQRVWGDAAGAPIGDGAADAIVPRLTQLLRTLAAQDPQGHWDDALKGGEPRWDRIVLAGQSQGGGMAAYLAQTRAVAGVLMFSGGWDHGPDGGLARWYRRPSATPASLWHATFHVGEAQADALAKSAEALGIPAAQRHALDLSPRGANPHGEGIGNPAYEPLWREMLRAVRPP